MLPVVLMWALITSGAADAPRPKDSPAEKEATTFQVTGIEKGTLTVSLKDGVKASYSAVLTSDGPRIRLVCGPIALEAVRFQIQYGDTLIVMQAEKSSDGTKAFITEENKPLPTTEPVPKPKQP